MKLIKFVNGDAPQTFHGAELTAKKLTFKAQKNTSSASAPSLAKAWDLAPCASGVSSSSSYWLLDDKGKPLCVLQDVVLATPSEATKTSSNVPRGITDNDVKGLDLRSKLGQQLERTRAEYGSTYKTAAKAATTMMDAEASQVKRHERMKREREEVAEAVATGEGLPEKKAKRTKK